jgi:tetratricopeptide (TPR) repeat protein
VAPASLQHLGLVDGIRGAILLHGLFPPGVRRSSYMANVSPSTAIHFLEPKRVSRRRDWLVRYYLGDFYIRDKRYSTALEVLLEAFRLRPKDPRSTYALATAYRDLARAGLDGLTMEDLWPHDVQRRFLSENPEFTEMLSTGHLDIDPTASADELEKTGLTVDEVAEQAMLLFDETLRLGVRPEDAILVRRHLQRMYLDFPHLEMRVKARRNEQATFRGEARKGPGALYSEAVGHYTRLRFLLDDIPRYRHELAEVIRLCQWTITSDHKDGDAHILLANAYSLLDSQISGQGITPGYYMQWAGAVIHHWATTPLRQYPFTKNAEIGRQLLAGITEELATFHLIDGNDPAQGLARLAAKHLSDALSPASFVAIAALLRSDAT